MNPNNITPQNPLNSYRDALLFLGKSFETLDSVRGAYKLKKLFYSIPPQANKQPKNLLFGTDRLLTVPLGSSMVPLGLSMVPLGSSMVPDGSSMVPLGSSMVPVGSSMVPDRVVNGAEKSYLVPEKLLFVPEKSFFGQQQINKYLNIN
jgi:hypothetical protein